MKKQENKVWSLFYISEARNVLFGIATLWIAFFHSPGLRFEAIIPVTVINKLLYLMKQLGNAGVDIFLLLSGTGLYFSYSQNKDLKNFYQKRALRILPAVWIVVILRVAYVGGVGLKTYLQKIFLLDFFITGNKNFWYFSLIVILYLIYPILHKVIEKRKFKGTILIIFGIVCINFVLMKFCPVVYKRLEIGLTRIPIFVFGIFMGKNIKDKKELNTKWMKIFFILFIACIGMIIFLRKLNNKNYSFLVRYFYGFLAIFIVFLVSYFHSKMKIEFLNDFLNWIGNYSMEIYLLYEFLAMTLENIFVFNDASNIAYCISVFVLALVLSILLKKVCNTIKNEWFKI